MIGNFKRSDGLDNYEVGKLHLDCGIGGSRKNQTRYYTLFTVNEDETCTVIKELTGGNDWAIALWPAIEEFLNTVPVNPLEKFSTQELIDELNRREVPNG